MNLYQIDEIADLYVDAFLLDQSKLIFLSVWGRDTALQEFFARLTLPKSEQGLREIHLENLDTDQTVYVDIPDIENLTKVNGRSQSKIFGTLSHVFIYDKLADKPDSLNNKALLIYRDNEEQPDIWEIIKEACHLPLLDHWKNYVIKTFEEQGWLSYLTGEAVHAIKLDLNRSDVEDIMESAIKDGILTLKEGESKPDIPQPTAKQAPEQEPNSLQDARKAAKYLQAFIGKRQLNFMLEAIRGEEGQYFIDQLVETAQLIQSMPKTGEQEDKGDEAIAYLHYFYGGFDWYISEKDMLAEQHQAYGVANMGYPEYGYISITELIENNVELDLHFEPNTLGYFKKQLEDNNQVA